MKADSRTSNPVFGDQPFKIGLFGYLHEGGMALTKAPERWDAKWQDIAEMARIADEAGMDYLIPIANWKGWKGEIQHRRWSYETLNHAAALSGITKRIGLFATVHAPLVHPIFAAKALTTIDHASGGRAGLNIVCGWNPADFDMFGVPALPHDDRYQQGLEWFEILSRLLKEGGDKEFDYDGKYFRNLKGIAGEPPSLQQPYPAILSAAYSPAGRDFAIRTSDVLFTATGEFSKMESEVSDVRAREESAGRRDPIAIIGSILITCRPTRAEAQRFDDYFALEQVDNLAVDKFVSVRGANADAPSSTEIKRRKLAAGGGLVVGTPEDVVDVMVQMKEAGFSGATLTTLHFLEDLPLIVDRILPLMEQAGLRRPI